MKRIETSQSSSLKYERAKQKVAKLRDFYVHLAIYFIFVVFFFSLNARSGGFPWAIFPIAGWGIGVLGHAAETFEYRILFGKAWEARKIKQFMDEEDEIRF